MTNLHRILVPVDFSDASASAAHYASCWLSEGESELHLLHVLGPTPLDFALLEPTPGRQRELSAKRTEHALGELARFRSRLPANLDARLRVAEGEAAAEIIRYAHDEGMDAVVMPTRGRNRVERLVLIGSVTMKVLHALEKPVITGVQFEEHLPPASVNRVLCAVDLGPASERVLCAGAQAARRFHAQLSVVHAQPVFGAVNEALYEDSWRATVRERAMDKLQELARPLAGRQCASGAGPSAEGALKRSTCFNGEELGVSADLHVELDRPPRAISGMALKLAADLVVLGRGESDNLIGRLRADAYEIIRLCHCPVVSV